ncbi:MAG: HEAT repeat domain-containing protein [Acidobacteria bacterium]|nr:HEAT repeat domain-containing protein [Acidobacteriota bacterium]
MSTAPAPFDDRSGRPEPRRGALSPELTRQSIALARALAAAARNWSLYPPEHPAVDAAVRRFADAVRQSTMGAAFTFGVTPQTLLVAGLPLPEDRPVTEAARLLHDRDLLQITFLGDVPAPALQALLKLLTTPADDLRRSGGPARAWEAAGVSAIALEQIDYEKILEDRDVEKPLEDRHDDIWRSLVNTILEGRHTFDEQQQKRLLEISRSVFEIGELASAAAAPKCNADGSPLITTQAATVLAVFRHLAGIVTVMEPERLPEVMRNVAAATSALDPNVVLQMMQTDEGLQETPIVNAIAASFDDGKVAELLATALARDGRASARLAQVFDTIAPDDERKQRVLTMTRSMLSEQDFGKTGQFRAVWATMEELLLSYDETPYVSASYQAALEGAAGRGEMLASRDLPPELPEWVESLGQDSVRSLSVMLIADLLRIEENPERAADIMRDTDALLEDLFLAGDFANAVLVLRELKAASGQKVAPAAARAALAAAGESAGLRDAATLLGDLDADALARVTECCDLIGPTAVRALLSVLQSETDTAAYVRACDLVKRVGAAAVGHLAPLADDTRWFVQQTAAVLLGATRSAEAVPPLQSLLRRSDPRVLRAAVAALAGIDDPAAARAVKTALVAASGANRSAVVEALVAERDPRVVPMLARILTESDPFGDDHDTVLDALDAVRQLGHEQAVPPVAAVMRKKKLFARKKARAFKTASVRALAAIGTPKAQAALDDAARAGDGLLKRIIRDMRS